MGTVWGVFCRGTRLRSQIHGHQVRRTGEMRVMDFVGGSAVGSLRRASCASTVVWRSEPPEWWCRPPGEAAALFLAGLAGGAAGLAWTQGQREDGLRGVSSARASTPRGSLEAARLQLPIAQEANSLHRARGAKRAFGTANRGQRLLDYSAPRLFSRRYQ